MATTGQMGGPLRRFARLFGFGGNGSLASGGPPMTPAPTPTVRRDWATLPPLHTPLHRRVDESSHVTQFSTDVRRQLDTPAALAPLGHQVAMEAPRGIATGIARVVSPRGLRDQADLPLPARDHPGRAESNDLRWPTSTPATVPGGTSAAEQPEPAGSPAPTVPTPSASQTPPASAGRPATQATPRILRAAMPSAAPIPSPLATRPAGLTLRRVRAVPDTAHHPAHADPTSPAAPRVAGHDAAHVDRAVGEASNVPDRPTLGADPLTASSAATNAAGRAEPAATMEARREAADRGGQRATPPLRPTSAERPPSGVGPALSALPATARPVTRGSRPAGPSVTGHGRQDAISKGLQHLLPSAPSAGDDTALDMPIASPPQRATPPAPTGPPVTARRLPPRPGHAGVQRTATVAPLVGGRPPLVTPRRSPGAPGRDDGTGPVDGTLDEPPHRSEPSAVPVRWQTPDHRDPVPTLPPSLPRAETVPGSGTAATAISATGQPRPSQPAGARVSRQAMPASQPDGPSALRPTTSPIRAAVPLRRRQEGPEGSATAATPGVSRATEGTVSAEALPLPRFPALLRAVDDTPSAQVPAAPTASGATAGPAAPARPALPPPPVQREAEASSMPAAESADAASSGGDGAADTTTDVNAIFRKLYPRVRDELRWELRVQRERAGMLSDPL